ncbi:MAG: ABC transporter permease [Candidatus Aminicenantes bacterium]|nr:ABC transporter permease [Candidatus Aminicenantes bacterium]
MKLHLLKLFLNEFKKRKKKTSLITFAISWGTLSLLLMMSFGRGLSNQFRIGFQGLGEDLILVNGGRTSMEYQGLPKGRTIRLYISDIDLIRRMIPEIKRICPESYNTGEIKYKDQETNRNVRGVYADFGPMRNTIAQAGGRFINPDDVTYSRRVVFLGWKLAEELFKEKNPVDEEIYINRMPFKVIGVMMKKLQNSNYQGLDYDHVYIPLSTMALVDSQKYIDMMHIQPVERKYSRYVETRVKEILGEKYRFDKEDTYALSVFNTIEAGEIAGKVFMGIEIFLGLIGGLTLLIAAVGVTNLMYAVVKERTREIGVKMALGAKRRHIVWQFLLEALFIFLKGTFWGALIAFNIVSLVRLAPMSYEMTSIQSYLLRPDFSTGILVTFVVVMGILVFFSGIFPALRASKMNPVDALRYE